MYTRDRGLLSAIAFIRVYDLAGSRWKGSHDARTSDTRSLRVSGTRMVCCEALLFFGPCFFVAGVILYPQMLARREAASQVNSTVDFEPLGDVCIVRHYEYCWKTEETIKRQAANSFSCWDEYTYNFDAPSVSNLTSNQERVRRWGPCSEQERCACHRPDGCSTTLPGFVNRSFGHEENEIVECWAPRPGLLANLSTMYACANPSCHKLWDPAVELGEARWLTSLHVNVALGCLVFGICGWVAWAQVLWDCFCGKDDDDKKKKGVSAKLRRLRTSSRRTEQRVTRAVTRARTRKPPAEPQVVQATVVTGGVVSPAGDAPRFGEPTAPVVVQATDARV